MSGEKLRLLVASDFTEDAEKAARYAIQLAAQLQADLHFFHAYSLKKKRIDKMPADILHSLQNEGEFSAHKYYLKYLKHLRAELNEVVAIHPILMEGKAEEAIVLQANLLSADLIILGAGNRKRFSNQMLGNTTTAVIKKAPCPVLIVPEHTKWEPVKHIVYGTSFDEKDSRVPATIDTMAFQLNAHISCLHIKTEDEVHGKMKHPKLTRIFRLKEDPSNRIFFYTLIHPSILKGLCDFSKMYKADILSVLFPQKTGWDKWFGSSMARSLMFRTHVPLLVAVQ